MGWGSRSPGAVVMVVVLEEAIAEVRGVHERSEPVREGREYLRALKRPRSTDCRWQVWGRPWLLTIRRSASRSATGFEVIELPRSEWIVRLPGATLPWAATTCSIHSLTTRADSWSADQPAGAVAAEDVEHHEQVIGDAPGRTAQGGRVIGPHLVGPTGDELGHGSGRMAGLAPALPELTVGPESRYIVDSEPR